MPYTKITGSSGTITGTGGNSDFTHTTSSNEDLNDLSYSAITNGYWIGNGDGIETHTHAFSQLVGGAIIEFNATNPAEPTFIVLDGTTIDLNAAVAAGDVSFDDGGGIYEITAAGAFAGIEEVDLDISGFITINIPFTTLQIDATVNGPGGTNGTVYAVFVETDPPSAVCFAKGTSIRTPTGQTPIERLSPGDLVETYDHGPQPISWIGSVHFDAIDPIQATALRPIRIAPGALGRGTPSEPLTVSRHHRLLVSSLIAERIFGVKEVLVPACKLLRLPGVEEVTNRSSITYFHLLFPRHEVIWAEGALSESLLLGPQGLKALGSAARAEIKVSAPEIGLDAVRMRGARFLADGGPDVKDLIARHLRHAKPLVAEANQGGAVQLCG